VTLEAVNVEVTCGILNTTRCSEDCLMSKAKLYATIELPPSSVPFPYLRSFCGSIIPRIVT